jgi:hypothetical protein
VFVPLYYGRTKGDDETRQLLVIGPVENRAHHDLARRCFSAEMSIFEPGFNIRLEELS